MYVKPIAGDVEVSKLILADLSRQTEILQTLNDALNNRELVDPFAENKHEPYLCIGCKVGDGKIRKAIINMAIHPLLHSAVEVLTGYRFTRQAYFAQTYEPKSGPGPGGVAGIRTPSRKLITSRGSSASVALKMGQWVSPETDFPYLPEKQAEVELWQFAEKHWPAGMSYLRSMTVEPTEPQLYPQQLVHDLNALLGIEAVRNLVAENLGLRLVLIDGDRLIGEDYLKWEHYSPWAV